MWWYQLSIDRIKSILPTKDEFEKDRWAYNMKYGNYDYSNDLREARRTSFDKVFKNLIKGNFKETDKILVVGANSGDEFRYLEGFDAIALDLSINALIKLKQNFPKVEIVEASVNSIPFDNDVFDNLICLRTLQSRSVDLSIAIDECLRVVKDQGNIITSIPNGYFVSGQVVKGMYCTKSGKFDVSRTKKMLSSVRTILEKRDVKFSEYTCISEEFVSFTA